MISVDTNLLVYAHRQESEWHEEALRVLKELAESRAPWAIPWPCVHEFLAIVTHPRIYLPPTPLKTALEAMEAWMDSPSCRMLGEGPGYFETLRAITERHRVHGPRIHDARIAALCLHHGVTELWTLDRDFSRFSALKARNPLSRA